MEERFGVFVWSAENRYPKGNAIRTFVRRSAADRLVESVEGRQGNWVVRSVWFDVVAKAVSAW